MSSYKEDISPEDFDEIERYILGDMDSLEKTRFETRLSNEPDLENEVILQRKLMAGIEASMFIDAHPIEIESTEGRSSGAIVRKFNWKWTAAATLLVCVAGAGWWFVSKSEPAYEKLFYSYHTPDPGLPSQMGISENYAFDEAMIDYKQEKYSTAISKWQPLLTIKNDSDTLNYFLGMAWLNQGNAKMAIPFLQKVRQGKSPAFQDRATWYLALSYLKLNDTEKARDFLLELPYDPLARELLAKPALTAD